MKHIALKFHHFCLLVNYKALIFPVVTKEQTLYIFSKPLSEDFLSILVVNYVAGEIYLITRYSDNTHHKEK